MTVERPEKVYGRTQKLAEKIANRQVRAARKISRKANIAERFNLSDEQMSIYNSAFAMYLQTKSDREASDLAKNSEYEMMLKYPVLKFIARIVLSSAERERLTVMTLKESVEDQSTSFVTQEDGIGPGRLVNAANYLSTKYLEGSDSFSDQVKESKVHVDRLLRR